MPSPFILWGKRLWHYLARPELDPRSCHRHEAQPSGPKDIPSFTPSRVRPHPFCRHLTKLPLLPRGSQRQRSIPMSDTLLVASMECLLSFFSSLAPCSSFKVRSSATSSKKRVLAGCDLGPSGCSQHSTTRLLHDGGARGLHLHAIKFQ